MLRMCSKAACAYRVQSSQARGDVQGELLMERQAWLDRTRAGAAEALSDAGRAISDDAEALAAGLLRGIVADADAPPDAAAVDLRRVEDDVAVRQASQRCCHPLVSASAPCEAKVHVPWSRTCSMQHLRHKSAEICPPGLRVRFQVLEQRAAGLTDLAAALQAGAPNELDVPLARVRELLVHRAPLWRALHALHAIDATAPSDELREAVAAARTAAAVAPFDDALAARLQRAIADRAVAAGLG